MKIKFSVIIPTYKNESFLDKAILSVLKASKGYEVEIIVVDDGSPQKNLNKIKAIVNKYTNIKFFAQKKNEGPGIARNYGIKKSTGDYILFLDSDDFLQENIFSRLEKEIITNSQPDLLFFNWSYSSQSKSISPPYYEGRDDLDVLQNNDKEEIITQYLLNRIDNSIIYSAIKKSFLQSNNLTFHQGLHEDVSFVFKILLKCHTLTTIKETLYIKHNNPESIINNLNENHIEGYFQALEEIYDSLNEKPLNFSLYKDSYTKGLINIVAKNLLKINSLTNKKKPLIELIYKKNLTLTKKLSLEFNNDDKTKYEKIFNFFNINFNKKDGLNLILKYLDDIKDKSWSCFDLHNSVFLAPDEIRTCCKRFFYKNKLKGDVTLFKEQDKLKFNYKNILDRKKQLFKKINQDNAEECQGCPFLKFDNWQGTPLSKGIKYLSFEYHSVCNMRCSYCSDTYYGGKKASYDVEKLINEFKNNKAINNVPYVVWGGGEPTLDKSFPETLKILDSENLGDNKQRIITNSVKYLPEIQKLMDHDKAYIITSIDAGTKETFKKIRGITKIDLVMENLKKYSTINPNNIIIKYIVLNDNSSDIELQEFVKKIKEHDLLKCSFQISCDFKSSRVVEKILIQLCYLYCLLLEEKGEFIFLDDLVWQRLMTITPQQINKIKEKLIEHKLSHNMITPKEYDNTIVWGTGAQAKLIIQKTTLLQKNKIKYFIDSYKKMNFLWGKKLNHPFF